MGWDPNARFETGDPRNGGLNRRLFVAERRLRARDKWVERITRGESAIRGGPRWRSHARTRQAPPAPALDRAPSLASRLVRSAARHRGPHGLASSRSSGSARTDRVRSRTRLELRSHRSRARCRGPMPAQRCAPDHIGLDTAARVARGPPRSAPGYRPKARPDPRLRRGSPRRRGHTPPTGGDKTVTNGPGRTGGREVPSPRAKPAGARLQSNRGARNREPRHPRRESWGLLGAPPILTLVPSCGTVENLAAKC